MNQTQETQGRGEPPLQSGASPWVRNGDDQRVVRALEDYLAAVEEERAPDRQQFLARYPEIAAELADCLHGLEFIRSAFSKVRQPLGGGFTAAVPTEDIPSQVPLGDYRIVREIGRGAWGWSMKPSNCRWAAG